jgi:single-strand DNA-binding protein
MNSLANRVTLIGNLGKDPETKTTDSGKKITHFTLATNDGYKNTEGERVNETTWHNIVAWNGLADIAGKFLKKGREVAVEGRIVYRTYEDKKGVTKISLKMSKYFCREAIAAFRVKEAVSIASFFYFT